VELSQGGEGIGRGKYVGALRRFVDKGHGGREIPEKVTRKCLYCFKEIRKRRGEDRE